MEIFAVPFEVTRHLLPAEPEGELHEPEIVKVYGQAEEFYLQDFFVSAFSSAVFFAALSLESRQIGLLVVLSSGSVSCLPRDSNVCLRKAGFPRSSF